jgi:hypothetical protein
MESHAFPKDLQSLYAFASEKYGSLIEKAKASDDSQEVFTSSAEHYVKGSDFTARIALRVAKTSRESL